MKIIVSLIVSSWYSNSNDIITNSIISIVSSINDIESIDIKLMILTIDDTTDDDTLSASLSTSLSTSSSSSTMVKVEVDRKRDSITTTLLANRITRIPWIVAASDDLSIIHSNYIDTISTTNTTTIDIGNEFTSAVDHYNNYNLIDALKAFERVIANDANHKEALYNVACILHMIEYPLLAIHYVERLLLIDPTDKTVFAFLWALAQHQDHRSVCIDTYTTIASKTGSIEAKHKLTALTGIGNSSCKGDPLYARVIYDDMAEKFETRLVSHLGYRGPWILFNMFKEYFSHTNDDDKRDAWRILDCGCGSGLVGRVFAEFVGRVPTAVNPDDCDKVPEIAQGGIAIDETKTSIEALKVAVTQKGALMAGVDISQKMVYITASNGGYDCVICADLQESLLVFHSFDKVRENSMLLDLVIAADTFIYIGALGTIFEQTRRALKQGGFFAFSVEALENSPMKIDISLPSPPNDIDIDTLDSKISTIEVVDNEPVGASLGWGIQLLTSARYAHSKIYIHILAHINCFDVVSSNSTVLRTETATPLEGMMYILRLR